jgi:hypothetical protein
VALLAGCQSATAPGSGNHASVSISGATGKTIRQAVASVFQHDGYTLVSGSQEPMVFERPASSWDSAKWGGWGHGGIVMMRVKIRVEMITAGTHVVTCSAFYVTDSGDRVFEDEHRLMLLNRQPYQKLLEEASRQVQTP